MRERLTACHAEKDSIFFFFFLNFPNFFDFNREYICHGPLRLKSHDSRIIQEFLTEILEALPLMSSLVS